MSKILKIKKYKTINLPVGMDVKCCYTVRMNIHEGVCEKSAEENI
jgi:hypothetical protein